MRALGPKGSSLYDNVSVIPINIMEEMAPWVKSYIDLAIAIDGKTTQKELKKRSRREKTLSTIP